MLLADARAGTKKRAREIIFPRNLSMYLPYNTKNMYRLQSHLFAKGI